MSYILPYHANAIKFIKTVLRASVKRKSNVLDILCTHITTCHYFTNTKKKIRLL